jgi:hypothetical protein
MLTHPRDADPARFRRDLLPRSNAPGALIDRDGDRLNAVFNGELALQAGDFTLVDGAFRYGPASRPAGTERPITEAEGLAFVTRWFADETLTVDAISTHDWIADDATLHGAGCDAAERENAPASIGGKASGRLAATTLQHLLEDRLGARAKHRVLQPPDMNAPYDRQPISAWSQVAFQTQWDSMATHDGRPDRAQSAPIRYCAQWIMRLRAGSVDGSDAKAEEIWLNLTRLDDPGGSCVDAFDVERAAGTG